MRADGNQINALPEDPAVLQALLLAAWSERDKVVAERNDLAEQNERLQHLLLKFNRLQFGAKSEKLPEEQLQLALGDVETLAIERIANTCTLLRSPSKSTQASYQSTCASWPS